MLIPPKGKYIAELLSDITELKSGLILARTLKEKRHRAKVIAVGSQNIDKKGKVKPIVAKAGDTVHIKQGFGVLFIYEGRKLISLVNEDILAVE